MNLHRRPGGLRLVFYLIVVFVLAFGAVSNLVGGDGRLWSSSLAMFGFLLLLWALPLAMALANWKSHKLARRPYSGAATPAGVWLKSAHGEATIPWDAFYTFKESSQVVLLYQSRLLFQMVPRRFFLSDADWNGFREMVRARAPRGKGGQWVVVAVFVIVFFATMILLRILVR